MAPEPAENPTERSSGGRRVLLAVLLAGMCLMALFHAQRAGDNEIAQAPYALSGETMGTTWHAKIAAPPQLWQTLAPRLPALIQDRLDRVNALMSTYDPGSELSRFNSSQSTAPFPIAPETAAVFQTALRVSTATDGAFDVTVGPLVNAWGFGPEKRSFEGPDAAALEQLRSRVGYEHLELDAAAGTLRKAIPEIYCDLSAVAKGYAVDYAAEALEAAGAMHYMLEVGGEVRTGGTKFGQPWRIAIERPVAGRHIQQVVAMPPEGLALATSGDYRNYYEVDGVRLSHTIDPRTGRPIAHALASVSVFRPACAEADALATALMVLGEDAGLEWAEAHAIPALFIVRTAPGAFEPHGTTAFQAMENDPPSRPAPPR